MIAIVDYGLGNVKAFANVYKKLGLPVTIASTATDLDGAAKVILPGVGAFDQAMAKLEASGMRAALDDLVLVRGVPALGVCVGMHMFAERSEEGTGAGLGWLPAEVKKFQPVEGQERTCIPHMGWNDVKAVGDSPLLANLGRDGRFYFLHSYYFACGDDAHILAVTDYGGEFACAVGAGNIYGVQFHPEKSHQWGIQLLKNFGEL